jgi:AraC-like DNA-binding protein
MFCEINPDRRNLHGGRLLSVGVQQRPQFGTQMPGAGAVHPIRSIPLITEDHHLLEALQPICEEAAKDRKTVRGTVRSLVENELQKLLHHGKANRKRVSKALGLSERTLSEGLARENTSFDHVVDRLRHSLALQYVKDRHISIAQIAWLLGYEGPTSFNSAFSRWTCRSASEVRNENQQPHPSQQ